VEKVRINENYHPNMDLKTNEFAIRDVRNYFEKKLRDEMMLIRVTAPLLVRSKTGINDDLNGVEEPVRFTSKDYDEKIEIVHSLAKWKRMNIGRYNLNLHEGIYTDMNAIRKDEDKDNYHSIYVDQWDYELLISKDERNLETLYKVVKKIYKNIYDCEKYVEKKYKIKAILPSEIYCLTSSELLDLYPNLDSSQRVEKIVKKYKAVFVSQIGWPLKDGKKQDLRAPDYDDWLLNGDIFVYNPILDDALELSSMGIRVDKESLVKQAKASNKKNILDLKYQQKIINGEVPFTLGGGIGQSRICMFMLKKMHIGEVQSSIWDEKTYDILKKRGITLL